MPLPERILLFVVLSLIGVGVVYTALMQAIILARLDAL